MRLFIVIFSLLAGCATKKAAEVPPVADVRADGSFLFLTTTGAEAATAESLTHAMATLCDPACDRVYVDIGTDPPAAVLQRIVDAAAAVEPAPRVFLVPSTQKSIELDTRGGACDVTVVVRNDGAAVWRDGNPIAPDAACEVWNTAICRGEDRDYDWPRLRSEVGVVEEICVGFEIRSAAELVSIHETLRQPLIRLVQPETREAKSPIDELTARIKASGREMQWCLDGEAAETEQVPMQLTLRVGVHADGSITRVEVVDGVRTTANFEECVADVARKFAFEPREAAGIAEVRLSFEPGGSGPTIEAE